MIRHSLPTVFLCSILLAGCSEVLTDADRTAVSTEFSEIQSLQAAMRKAESWTVYEGIPRGRENAVRPDQAELQTLHGHHYYRTALKLSAEDTGYLKPLFSDEHNYEKWGGEKKCGGFHPDFLVVAQVGKVSYRVLICMSCHEVKIYGPGKGVRVDIRRNAYDVMGDVLKKYRKHQQDSDI